jgi:tetratricopeptide (TPR) repeat protein
MTDSSTNNILAEIPLFLRKGQVASAIEHLQEIEPTAWRDGALLQRIAEGYLLCSQHSHAHRCYLRSLELKPNNPRWIYNLAASKIAMGELDDAQSLLNQVIKEDPADYDAWQNRSTLRKQTPQDNHVEQLKFVLQHLDQNDPGQVPVCYALSKELEDLERYDESFRYLQRGAHRRRKSMNYQVSSDTEAMEKIASVFTGELLHSRPEHHDSKRPVFIVGMPRSGTTLVDRIISAHSQADSLGETNMLAFAVIAACSSAQDQPGNKLELIERSAQSDFAALGRFYAEGTLGYGLDSARLVDKTPLNFLYLGLIHLALPKARIIHLRRNPVDSCYAMYKTLFRMGFPFTYSLQDVGRYYIAYHRLMDHWRQVMPGAFLDVDYETLVTGQEEESRRIIEYLGLGWERACLDFHSQSGPAATASAAQVRQPIYASSVGRWRCYERQLTPLARKLREHGIEID